MMDELFYIPWAVLGDLKEFFTLRERGNGKKNGYYQRALYALRKAAGVYGCDPARVNRYVNKAREIGTYLSPTQQVVVEWCIYGLMYEGIRGFDGLEGKVSAAVEEVL